MHPNSAPEQTRGDGWGGWGGSFACTIALQSLSTHDSRGLLGRAAATGFVRFTSMSHGSIGIVQRNRVFDKTGTRAVLRRNSGGTPTELGGNWSGTDAVLRRNSGTPTELRRYSNGTGRKLIGDWCGTPTEIRYSDGTGRELIGDWCGTPTELEGNWLGTDAVLWSSTAVLIRITSTVLVPV